MPTQAYRTGDFTSAGCLTYDVNTLTCTNRQAITLNGAPAVDAAGR